MSGEEDAGSGSYAQQPAPGPRLGVGLGVVVVGLRAVRSSVHTVRLGLGRMLR